MSDQIVHDAYARVRSRYADEEWYALPPRTITDEIYREIRRMDAERLRDLSAGKATVSYFAA
jgi:hypothetical protein